jgi:methylmalonyl-CoA mutase C-terminal domain/subunit
MIKRKRKNRVLIAKPGLDGHDRGAKIISRALRDNEFEVIYTGIRQTPGEIASAALQEDVAVIGLSSLSGAHIQLFPAVVEELKKAGAGDIKVLGGGIIPDEDIALLKEAGITAVFTPGTPLKVIIDAFRDACDSFYHGVDKGDSDYSERHK